MKKGLLLILSLALVFTLVMPSVSFASITNYDEELEEAILKAKKVFSITDEYDKFDYNVNSYNNKTEFYLNWSDSDNKLGSISMTIDTEGRIRNYNSYTPYYGEYKPRLAKVSKKESKNISDEFIQKIDSGYVGKIEYIDNNMPLNVHDRYYYFTYTRKENGVLFPSNIIRVSVDNMTGNVRSFYANWDDNLEFPDLEGIITLDEAKSAYKDKIGLQLVYKFKYIDNETIPYLVYTNMTNEKSIDAISGEVFKGNMYYYKEEVAYEKSVADEAVGNSLSPAEQEGIDNIKGLLTEEDAEKLARTKLSISEDFELSYIRLYSNWRNAGSFTWSMRFQSSDEESPSSISISIDAKTGEITSFSKYIKRDENAVAKYDKDKAIELAKGFIKSYQPEKYEEVEYVTWNNYDIIPLENEELPKQYSFYFARKSNNAYVSNNGFNVTVDTVTGDIINYNFEWFKGELPTTDDAISVEEASEVLFTDIGMELHYTSYYNEDKEITIPEATEDNIEIKLVYSIRNDKPLNIDANTGDILNYSGEIFEEESIVEYTDIHSSYAKSQIEVLAQYGIALPGDKFNPSNEIIQREFLYLLAKANGYYIRESFSNDSQFDEVLYKRLMNEGIIKDGEKDPEAQINKECAVKFIIRALQYDKVASIPNIYIVNFKDADKISPELKGHIAIASGLNIIKGYDGYFNPTNNLTREQAATVIYNLLNTN